MTYAVVFGNKLSVKEKLFISLAWLPKATVQVWSNEIEIFTYAVVE